MEVLSSVSVALDDCSHINLGELGLEVLEAEHGLLHPLPGHGERVLPRVDVGHGAVVADEVAAGRGEPGVGEGGEAALRVVGVAGVGQQVGVGRRVGLEVGAVVHRVLGDEPHVFLGHLAYFVPEKNIFLF